MLSANETKQMETSIHLLTWVKERHIVIKYVADRAEEVKNRE